MKDIKEREWKKKGRYPHVRRVETRGVRSQYAAAGIQSGHFHLGQRQRH